MRRTRVTRTGTPAFVILSSVAVSAILAAGAAQTPPPLSPIEALGKRLFFDANLSLPPGQSCASCHDPKTGWTGTTENVAGIYEGAQKGRFGNRKPPSSAYAGTVPVLHRNEDGEFVGGLFWDGRATGVEGKDPLAEQAGGPFLNPLEHNFPDRKALVRKVRSTGYTGEFAAVWGLKSGDWDKDVDRIFDLICRSIAAFERSREVNPFNSRFDSFWRAARDKGLDPAAITEENADKFFGLGLDRAEWRGLVLFANKGRCSGCHALDPGPGGEPPVFSDFRYDNIGLPKNPENPFYGMGPEFNPAGRDWVDEGLGGFLKTSRDDDSAVRENRGKHRVPTLRNVDLRPTSGFVKVFGHNGFFRSLEEIVHFYNVRDLGAYPPPEIPENVNTAELGNLGLSAEEEAEIVAFLRTLSDGPAARPEEKIGK